MKYLFNITNLSFNVIMPPKRINVWNELCDLCMVRHSVKKDSQCYKKYFNYVINEIHHLPIATRKVCNKCHEVGHTSSAVICKVKMDKNNVLRNKIKKHMLSHDCLSGKTNDEHFVELSKMYEISINMCKTLYEEISPIELCDRMSGINVYVQQIKQMTKLNCHHCNKIIYNIQINTHRIWKGNTICDSCWSEHDEERLILWERINEHIKNQCYICLTTKLKKGERYHYDHINMFDKGNSICTMVKEGNIIDDIYIELDKCQVLCLSCHHIVTDIESKLGFSRIKQNLTRKLNNDEITDEEYNQQKKEVGEIYIKKMYEIYDNLKLYIHIS